MTAFDQTFGPAYSSGPSTRILKIERANSSPWVVCTQDAVPIILARFATQEQAEQWQSGLHFRRLAA